MAAWKSATEWLGARNTAKEALTVASLFERLDVVFAGREPLGECCVLVKHCKNGRVKLSALPPCSCTNRAAAPRHLAGNVNVAIRWKVIAATPSLFWQRVAFTGASWRPVAVQHQQLCERCTQGFVNLYRIIAQGKTVMARQAGTCKGNAQSVRCCKAPGGPSLP